MFLLGFIMYTRPNEIIAQRDGVRYHLYAGETELYISLDLDNELIFSSSLENIEQCIGDGRLWITHNVLKLIDNKIKLSIRLRVTPNP